MPPSKNKRTTVSDLFGGIDDLLESAVTHEEMKEVLDTVSSFMRELRTYLEQKVAQNKDEMSAETKRIGSQVAEFEQRIREIVDTKEKSLSNAIDKKVTKAKGELSSFIEEVRDLIEYYDDTEIRELVEQVRLEMPKMPEAFDASEILKTLDEHEREIEALKKRPATIRGGGGGLFGGKTTFAPMVDDFSELTNGSTKIFYLSKEPRSITTMKVWGSDFPYILRVNTDFTVARKVLTLTDEVDAPSQGATLICEYYV